MKVKGVYEAHQMTKEHGYLGDFRSTLEDGSKKVETIQRKTKGTSALSNDAPSAGNIPDRNERY